MKKDKPTAADPSEAMPSNENSRTQNSVNNIVTGLIAQIFSLGLQFVSRTVFIKVLGIAYLSVNGLFSNILTIFSFAELGIGQAIIFSLYKPIREKNYEAIRGLMELYRKTYRIIGMLILGVGVLFLPFLPFLLDGSAEGIENLYTIYLLFVLDSGISYFFSYRQSYLVACQQQYHLNIFNCIFSILREIVRVILILTVRRFVPLLIFGCVWTVLQNAFLSALAVKKHPYIRNTKGCRIAPEEKKTILQNIRALMLYKIGTLALNSTDNIIITAVVGLVWVGLYSNYAALVTSVCAFLSILFSSLTASIGSLNAGDDMARKKLIFNVTNLATFWIYSISSVCFLVALTPTVQLWLGGEYILSFPTVIVISANIYIGGMLFTPFNYRQTMGLFVYGKWRPIISAVINILVSILLGRYLGLMGVLLGTIIARVTTNVWYDPWVVYKKGFRESPWIYFGKYILYALLFAASCGLGVLISKITLFGGLLDILLHCILCFVVLSGIYYLLFRRTASFLYLKEVVQGLLKNLLQKLKKKRNT